MVPSENRCEVSAGGCTPALACALCPVTVKCFGRMFVHSSLLLDTSLGSLLVRMIDRSPITSILLPLFLVWGSLPLPTFLQVCSLGLLLPTYLAVSRVLLLLPVGTPFWLILGPGPSIQSLEWFLPSVPGYALVLSLIAASQADLTYCY